MKHIIKVENSRYLPVTRPLIAMSNNRKFNVIKDGPATNEIWYASSDSQKVDPNKTSALPTIHSNIYENGKGVIKFESDVTNIGDIAFNNCKELTSIEIPNKVTNIGGGTFSGCTNLTSVTIGNSVTSIGSYAFQVCVSLTSIEIPNTVTSIRDWAFGNCTGLTSITCEAIEPPQLGISVFDNEDRNRKIYVPSGSIDDYKNAENWSTYADRIYPISE